MSIIDSIIGAESGGNPNARLGEVFRSSYILVKFWIVGVIELLFVSCPSAVARLIANLRVDAINGVFRGRLHSHVKNKAFKAISPSVADANPFSSIVSVADIRRSRASLLHCAPRPILGGLLQSVGFHFSAHRLPLEAAAALRLRGSQAVLSNNRSVPAVACAAIASYAARSSLVRMPLWVYFKINNKSSNSLAREVNYHGA